MVKIAQALLLITLLILTNVSCKGKSMEEKKREEFLSLMTEKLKEGHSNYNEKMKASIKREINRNKEVSIEKMVKTSTDLLNIDKQRINKEYTNYELIYKGLLDDRGVLIIGKKYKKEIVSSLMWGVFYDITDKDFIKIGEFNNSGQFFYPEKDSSLNDKGFKYFYIVTFNSNKTCLKTQEYDESFVVGGGFRWWFDNKEKKWKWEMINPL